MRKVGRGLLEGRYETANKGKESGGYKKKVMKGKAVGSNHGMEKFKERYRKKTMKGFGNLWKVYRKVEGKDIRSKRRKAEVGKVI